MANQTINVLIDRYKSLLATPKAWLLVLDALPYLEIGDKLTVRLVDSIGTYLDREMYGIVDLIHSGEFYNLPAVNNLYHIEPVEQMPWIDYSATSIIVGFSSFTSKSVRYRIDGNTVYFQVSLAGVSNTTSLTFSMPFAMKSGIANIVVPCRIENNSAVSASPGIARLTAGANVITCFRTMTSLGWTASGDKSVNVEGFFEIDAF